MRETILFRLKIFSCAAGLLTLTASPSFSQAPDAVSIDQVLKEIEASLKAARYCSPATQDSAFKEEKNKSNSKPFCRPSFSFDAFCVEAKQACRNLSGSFNCWAPRDQNQRRSPYLRKEIFGKARTYFEFLKRDPETLNLCCQNSASCKEKLKETKLIALRGLAADDQTYYYNPSDHSIALSESMLLNCRSEQCIERSLLHELGHACQESRDPERDGYNWAQCEDENMIELVRAHLTQAMGKEVSNCVHAGLIWRKANFQDECTTAWMSEAFADAVFSSLWTDRSHWAWNCRGAEDRLHAAASAYMHCFFLPGSSLLKKFCGETPCL